MTLQARLPVNTSCSGEIRTSAYGANVSKTSGFVHRGGEASSRYTSHRGTYERQAAAKASLESLRC